MGRDIIVAGASAGGVEALRDLVSHLPGDLPASLFVVLHVPATGTSQLPAILSRAGPLPARHAVDGMPIEHGQIYVAPPDYHLVVQPEIVRVIYGPKENRQRPAIDVLFRAAALAYQSRVVGVLLSGTLFDGTAGMRAIDRVGGLALVQDPAEALFASMPANAIVGDDVDASLPIAALATRLVDLAHAPAPGRGAEADETLRREVELVNTAASHAVSSADPPGTPSGVGCPACGGVLWEAPEEGDTRFVCRVGHGYSPESLMLAQGETVEDALWVGLRALKEHEEIARRLATHATDTDQEATRRRYEARAAEAERRAASIEQVLEDGPLPPIAGDS